PPAPPVPSGTEEDGYDPSEDEAPASPPVAAVPALPVEVEPPAASQPVAPLPIRRVALLSELRAREEERDRLDAERRTQDRRNMERRSEAAFRNDPPPRVAQGGQMPG